VRGTDLQILEYYGIIGGSFQKLNNWMLTECRPPDDVLRASPVHSALVALTECGTFYTTNFDDYLERAFQLAGRTVLPIVTERDVVQTRQRISAGPPPIEVVKFHGDLNNPDEMVVSESNYERRLSFSTMLDSRLRSDVLGRAVLFLGYSFRDPNVAYLFTTINRDYETLPLSTSGHRGYIALPDPSGFEEELFKKRNIAVVPLDSAAPAQGIVDLLTAIAAP
jgi:hypothetical protein